MSYMTSMTSYFSLQNAQYRGFGVGSSQVWSTGRAPLEGLGPEKGAKRNSCVLNHGQFSFRGGQAAFTRKNISTAPGKTAYLTWPNTIISTTETD